MNFRIMIAKGLIRQITNGVTTLFYELIYLLFYMCKTLEDIFLRLAGIKNLNGGWLIDINNDTSMFENFRPSYFFNNSLIGNMFNLNLLGINSSNQPLTPAGNFFVLMVGLGFAIMFILFCVQLAKAMKGKKKQETKDVFKGMMKTVSFMILVPVLTIFSMWLLSNFFSILFQIINKSFGGNSTSLAESMFKDFFELPKVWKGSADDFKDIVQSWSWDDGDLLYDNVHQSLHSYMGLKPKGGEYAILIKFGTFRYLYATIGGALLVYSFFKLSLKATERVVKLTLLFYSSPLVIGTYCSKSGKEKFSAWKTQYLKAANEVLGFTLALLLYMLFLSLFGNALTSTQGINVFVKFLLRLVVMIAGGLMIEPLAKMLNEIFTAGATSVEGDVDATGEMASKGKEALQKGIGMMAGGLGKVFGGKKGGLSKDEKQKKKLTKLEKKKDRLEKKKKKAQGKRFGKNSLSKKTGKSIAKKQKGLNKVLSSNKSQKAKEKAQKKFNKFKDKKMNGAKSKKKKLDKKIAKFDKKIEQVDNKQFKLNDKKAYKEKKTEDKQNKKEQRKKDKKKKAIKKKIEKNNKKQKKNSKNALKKSKKNKDKGNFDKNKQNSKLLNIAIQLGEVQEQVNNSNKKKKRLKESEK